MVYRSGSHRILVLLSAAVRHPPLRRRDRPSFDSRAATAGTPALQGYADLYSRSSGHVALLLSRLCDAIRRPYPDRRPAPADTLIACRPRNEIADPVGLPCVPSLLVARISQRHLPLGRSHLYRRSAFGLGSDGNLP